MKIIIFNNGHTLASHTALLAFGESLSAAGFAVSFLNPNGYSAEQFVPADAAVVYGKGDKQQQIKADYRKAGAEVLDVSERLLRYNVTQILGGALLADCFPEAGRPSPEQTPPEKATPERATPRRSGRPKKK